MKFRSKNKVVRKWIKVVSEGKEVAKKFVLAGVPGEMMTISFSKKGVKKEVILEVE